MTPIEILTVTDRDGNLLEESRRSPVDVIRADTAYVMTNMLRGVGAPRHGCRGRHPEVAARGKTGTVDDNTDAWFVGFDPNMTVGVWVGLDEKKSLGANETGAVAALPIWMEFMKAYIEAGPTRMTRPTSRRPATSCSCPWTGPAGS